MSISSTERQELVARFGERKIRHIEQVHDEYKTKYYNDYVKQAQNKCINPLIAIGIIVMVTAVGIAVEIYVYQETTTSKLVWIQYAYYETTTWNGNYVMWLLPLGLFFLTTAKLRVNVNWD